jgi:transketolase
MRKLFAEKLHNEMAVNENIYLLTGDLGYGLWDRIKIDYPDRFINFLSSEQLMLGAAVGMALEGKIPVVYSISPFVLYRPFEWIRNYLHNENIGVKLVGGGRDRDYGYLGFSHWAEEDLDILSHFKHIKKFKPETLTPEIFESFIYNGYPSYLNLVR